VITEGCCYASVAGEQPVRVEAGTVVMFPQGDAQVLSNPAGLRDRHVGAALSLIHARPSYDWTLDSLAREAGASRTVLAERFVHFVGTPPMQYLSRWRMQIAASLLCDGQANLARIAEVVGYESEASFSRAFKKVVGSPPGTWRRGRARRAVA